MHALEVLAGTCVFLTRSGNPDFLGDHNILESSATNAVDLLVHVMYRACTTVTAWAAMRAHSQIALFTAATSLWSSCLTLAGCIICYVATRPQLPIIRLSLVELGYGRECSWV
jgi:hypothetical protein